MAKVSQCQLKYKVITMDTNGGSLKCPMLLLFCTFNSEEYFMLTYRWSWVHINLSCSALTSGSSDSLSWCTPSCQRTFKSVGRMKHICWNHCSCVTLLACFADPRIWINKYQSLRDYNLLIIAAQIV